MGTARARLGAVRARLGRVSGFAAKKNIKEFPLKIKSKIYEKLKIWRINVIFQKKSLEKLFHEIFKFSPKIAKRPLTVSIFENRYF